MYTFYTIVNAAMLSRYKTKTHPNANSYLIQTNYTPDYLQDNITKPNQTNPISRTSQRQNVTSFQLIINLRHIVYLGQE